MGRRKVELEGTYTSMWHTMGHSRTDAIENPGPPPYTKTTTSIQNFVEKELANIGFGKRVRITVEEVE